MRQGLIALPLLLVATGAAAHSASDAYLTLTVDPSSKAGHRLLHGQWDIALRDLNFILDLDDDGDGQITWGEMKHHRAAIERYAYAALGFGAGSAGQCLIEPLRQWVDEHADGTYAVLFFDVVCDTRAAALTMNYTLFFAVDPSHRGIFVLHAGDDTSTAVLSPDQPQVSLAFD